MVPTAAPAPSFDAFLESAWNDHADRPAEVADRLAASLERVAAASNVVPYARIVTHVFGEHLGEWTRGVDLLASLRSRPAYDGNPASEGVIARGIAALRYASGDGEALDALSREDAIAALATASAAFAGRGAVHRGIAAYERALGMVEDGLPAGSPAARALAVGGNNLAATLEEKPDRDAAEDAAMVRAAQAALAWWKRAGGWLEEERAEYRLAWSLLHARRAEDARAAAERCLAVCERHDAPAIERFFAHATVAAAAREAGDAAGFAAERERARATYEAVPEGERPYCARDLARLEAP